MTEEQLDGLGSALDDFLKPYLFCCGYTQTFGHLHTYCRGLLSELKRKSVEPIALAAGCAVRTLQEFLRDHLWQHAKVRDQLQRDVGTKLADLPDDGLGNVGLIDETSALKSGTKTPGVQRQYLGCVGKVDNGIVTVHLGVCKARYKTLIDAELFLPQDWANDRDRCKEAGIPDDMEYRPKSKIALEEIDRAKTNRVHLDWITFDEGYGKAPEFIRGLDDRNLPFVGEVPKSLSCLAVNGSGKKPDAEVKGRRADNVVQNSESVSEAAVRQGKAVAADGGHPDLGGEGSTSLADAGQAVEQQDVLADLGQECCNGGREVFPVQCAKERQATDPDAGSVLPLERGAHFPGGQE